ncbi:general negative regulator of transcription subunit 4 [Colletotrichum truncatum]|uniref:General negative regulator of transcription subunit 4 n=1 Tax=Colletotrichum truncatum TaxID=5467 RepID=A0ACC3ZCN1_COLTU|nr:general negative regulator of transcription subunit 4 [Colletotrichum truncatum]KAF6797826.1 general negative regulator of transcription subunit 4 [Colletotrichum truncatum]
MCSCFGGVSFRLSILAREPWLTGSLDDELPSLDEATSSVDALVSDDPMPHFGGLSRPAVPTPPPGLGPPQRTASPALRQAPVPVVPLTPHAPTAPKATPTMANVVRAATPDLTPRKKVPGSEAKKNIKALAIESGLSKDIASQASPSKTKSVLQEEDFPALDAVKANAAKANAQRPGTPARSAVSTPKIAPASIKKPQAEPPASFSEAPKPTPKPVEKKPVPSVLNIAAATKAAQLKPAEPTTAEHSDSSAFPALPTPTTASVASPVTRTAPKTLRVVPTPKTEVPPALVTGAFSAAARAVSSASGRPGTPASEIISDSASIVSASISASRTSSPPPSKVGTAPVRATTKSQQRKQRKEAHKEQSASIVETTKQPEPEEQAPIIGRKKKQKKEKAPSQTSAAAKKAAERAATPPVPLKIEEPPAPPKPILERTVVDLPPPKGKAAKTAAKNAKALEEKGKAKESIAAPAPPTPPAATAVSMVEESQDIAENPKTIPEVVFQDLVSVGEAPPADLLTLLKPLMEQNTRLDRAQAAAQGKNPPPSTTTKGIITESDHATLLSGQPVRKVIEGQRVLITPNGDCLRNLTEEEEDKYLELQMFVAEASDQPDSFVAPRHQARPGGFSLIKGRAVPNGPPSYFPPSPNAQKMFSDDPVNKIQREEAISYINQYVLPRLNLGNTNLFPGSWKSAPGAKDALSARETAAASLNSLAPYIYGHDAAAGAGIYSAESGGSGKDIPEDETPFGGLDSPHQQGEAAVNASASAASAAAAAAAQAHAQHGSANSAHPKLPGTPLNSMTLMSVEDAEAALALARKETEKLEKNLNQAIKRNRRLLLGSR